jgi:serine/threonine-protein kinase
MEQAGRYEILAELGRGGMGIVYRATDTELGRTVAVKTLRLSDYATPREVAGLRERLVREARAAGHLNHPNIVAVHDIGQEGDTAYIVMEFVDGRNLDDMLAESAPLPVDLALRILADAARALDHAHARGTVRRHVKPANRTRRESCPTARHRRDKIPRDSSAVAQAREIFEMRGVRQALGSPVAGGAGET